MKSKLESLRTRLLNEPLFELGDELFAGADLIVSPTPVPMEPGKTVVVTKHALALSSLIFQLKDACGDWLDHLNKYDFYATLGEAANDYLASASDLRGLLLHVVDAALEMDERCNRFLYFAYGSNMDEAQMARRCPDARVIGTVAVPGWRFALDAAGVATILPDEASSVEGLLWSVTPEDIRSLDRYEGVRAGCYRRETLPIGTYPDRRQALVYLSNREPIPRGHREGYMARIVQAALDHDFSRAYIRALAGFLPDVAGM